MHFSKELSLTAMLASAATVMAGPIGLQQRSIEATDLTLNSGAEVFARDAEPKFVVPNGGSRRSRSSRSYKRDAGPSGSGPSKPYHEDSRRPPTPGGNIRGSSPPQRPTRRSPSRPFLEGDRKPGYFRRDAEPGGPGQFKPTGWEPSKDMFEGEGKVGRNGIAHWAIWDIPSGDRKTGYGGSAMGKFKRDVLNEEDVWTFYARDLLSSYDEDETFLARRLFTERKRL